MRRRTLLAAASLALFSVWTFGAELSGLVESVSAADPQGDLIASRVRFRAELRGGTDEEHFLVSASLPCDPLGLVADDVALEEAYFGWASERVDLRVGNLLITWGRGDGVFISDVFNPFDFRDAAVAEYADLRIPVPAARLRVLSASTTLELVWVPVFIPSRLPEAGTPWAAGADYSGYDNTENLPERNLENGAAGVRVTRYVGSLDASAFVSTVHQDTPEVYVDSGDAVAFEYPRLLIGGVDGAFVIGSLVFRCEAAYVAGTKYSDADHSALFGRDTAKFLLGADRSGGFADLSLQISDVLVVDHSASLAAPRNTLTATAEASKKLLRDTLELSLSGSAVLSESDWGGDASFVLRSSAEYAFSDAVAFSFGLTHYRGDEETAYGRYADNSNAWLKAAYRF